MKIGILTFHSQLNYGGVLQCWALVQTLQGLGHDVVVIDRRFDDSRSLHRTYFGASVRTWIRRVVDFVCGGNSLQLWVRAVRTNNFLSRSLPLTRYHFEDWKDAPKDLGVDLLVVGSDQVWHCGNWGDPRPYFLEGAPNVPAIAYAASIGLEKIPEENHSTFAAGVKRFSAISVRESRARELLLPFGVCPQVVLDPTLLIDPVKWSEIHYDKNAGRGFLVCYFVADVVERYYGMLEDYAKKHRCNVDVFINLQQTPRKRVCDFAAISKLWQKRLFGRVRVRYSAGPQEFVASFRNASAIVTDSFHALMFSVIFKKNIRLLAPAADWLKTSFSRIENFARMYANGSVVAESLQDALLSLDSDSPVAFNRERLLDSRNSSVHWLQASLCGVK